MSVQIEIQDDNFKALIRRATEAGKSLKVPFKLIQESWFKGNRAIFSLSGPGQYADLKESTKK